MTMATALAERPVRAETPLAPGQTERWLAATFDPHARRALNESVCLVMVGEVDVDRLELAIGDVLVRHDFFRIRFSALAPVQSLDPNVELRIRRVDLRAEANADAALEAFANRAIERDFELERAPHAEFSIVLLAQQTTAFHILYSHLVCDGWSVRGLFTDVGKAYRLREAGEVPKLRRAATASGFVGELLTRWHGPDGDASLAWWKQALQQPPTPVHLGDRTPVGQRHFRARTLRGVIGVDTMNALHAIALQHEATLFHAVLAALAMTLQRRSGREDFVIAFPFAGHALVRGAAVVTDGAIDLPLRVHCRSGQRFAELLQDVRDRTTEALKHPFVTQGRVAQALGLHSKGHSPPLAGILCNMVPRGNPKPFEPLQVRGTESDKFYLLGEILFNLLHAPDGLSLTVHYSTDFFSEARARAVFNEFLEVCTRVASPASNQGADAGDAGAVVSGAAGTGAEGAAHAGAAADADAGAAPHSIDPRLVAWNATEVPLAPNVRIEDWVARQAAATPDALALWTRTQSLSYAELDSAANRVAHWLRARGALPGDRVGLCLDRSAALLPALLGILKAGAAYVPMDPGFPPARLAAMVDDAAPRLVVTQAAHVYLAGLPRDRLLLVDDDEAAMRSSPDTPLAVVAHASDAAAYVIYTSGSTGQPKGVVVPQRAVCNFLASMRAEPGLSAGDRLLAVTTLSFDIAVLELLLPLVTGAAVVLADRADAVDGAALAALIHAHGVRVMQGTPTTWQLLLGSGWRAPPGFRALCGGEAMPQPLAAALLGQGVALWNLYGPTETTVWSTLARIEHAQPITVGRPIANTQVWVVDDAMAPCAVGVPGEICIGGAGLATGYLHSDVLTAERFVHVPFGAPGGQRLYRTGDLGRWRADGQLEHLGRLDFQVKVRGYRIELGEIEAGLEQTPGVARAVVVAREAAPGDVALVGYVVPSRGAALDGTALREALRHQLPAYMLPRSVLVMAALPTLPNGKIDRSALPAPAAPDATHAAAMPVAVRTMPALGTAPSGPPVSAATTQLMQTIGIHMGQLLGRGPLGAGDDFFAFGGNSLLAAQLSALLVDTAGHRPGLRAIFEAPTPGALALAMAGSEVSAAPFDSLLPLRRTGTRPPVFFIHDGDGETYIYRSLARRLHAEVPVYFLQPLASGDLQTVHTRVEDMAAHYVARIRSVQPHGPYQLGGLCAGGVIAFEMALQLQRVGEAVSHLFLIEATDIEAQMRTGHFAAGQIRRFGIEWKAHVSQPQPGAVLRATRDLAGKVLTLLALQVGSRISAWRARRAATELREYLDRGVPPPARLRKVTATDIRWLAQAEYRHREPYQGNVILFRAMQGNGDATDEAFVDLYRDPQFGWGRSVRGTITCVDVPGGHFSMLREPHVEKLAEAMQELLDA